MLTEQETKGEKTMKLYYHQTDGGAEYYCAAPVPGTDEGDLFSAVLRTDGNEIEVFTEQLKRLGIRLVIN